MRRQLSFVVLTAELGTDRELRAALERDHRGRIVASSDQVEQVYAEVVRSRPSAVIVTLDGRAEAAWMLCRQINATCPDTVIICASRYSSPDMILDSLRAGAREFLRLPIIEEELITVLERTAEFRTVDAHSGKERGRVIAVFSNKGGCGTSFIAANLAVALNTPTLLVDLNLQAGNLDLFFGVKPKYSIVDMVENRTRLDDQMFGSYLVQCSNNLVLLAAPQDAEAADQMQAEHVTEAIDFMRTRYKNVVLDLSHTFDPITISALDQADDILLVLTLDILASRAAQRSLAIFNRLGYSRQKVRLVLNRWSKQSDLELRYIERFLNERVTCFITDDYRTVVNSVNLGKPLVSLSASSTPIVTELKRLADIYGAPAKGSESESRKNILSSLLGKESGSQESQNVMSSLASSITSAFRRQSGSGESQRDDAK
ncbi:MAG: CpaE family protein [Blastocatellales bacterium]